MVSSFNREVAEDAKGTAEVAVIDYHIIVGLLMSCIKVIEMGGLYHRLYNFNTKATYGDTSVLHRK